MIEQLLANPRLVFLVLIVAAVALIVWYDRDNIERHSFLFFRRTKRGVERIHSIASRFPRFWNWYGWGGVVTGIASIGVVTYWLGDMLVQMVVERSAQGGPSLVLPGLVGQNQFQPGVSFIPVEYWFISIAILMVVHELSHGVVASREGFEINSVGWLILGIIPGAFVEPKGEEMLPGEEDGDTIQAEGAWEQGDWKSRLKVLSAGSWANYLTGAIFLGLALGLTAGVSVPGDVVYRAQDNYSAAAAGMDNGTLVAIDGQRVTSPEVIVNATEAKQPGDTVELWSSEGNFTVTLSEHPREEDSGYIGINIGQLTTVKQQFTPIEGFMNWLISLLMTIAALNIGIGLFNMVPVKPLDGGQVLDALVERFRPDWQGYLQYWHVFGILVVLTMVLASIVGAF